MQVLNKNHSDFLVAHFQGGSYNAFVPIGKWFNTQKVIIPDNISIVTIANNPELCMLIHQLEENKIPYKNTADLGGDWSNTLKPGYIRKALEQVNTEYVLILDAGDVLLTGSIIDIIDRFNEYDKKLLFGATKSNHPNLLIDKIRDRDFRGEFRFLNAGTCFGLTEYCKDFYKATDYLIWSGELKNYWQSEQFLIRHVFKDRTEDVDFDYRCTIFQTFGKTEATLIDEENEVYVIA